MHEWTSVGWNLWECRCGARRRVSIDGNVMLYQRKKDARWTEIQPPHNEQNPAKT